MAHLAQKSKIKIYENGILSLNPSFSRRFVTKTTHPQVFGDINRMLTHLGSKIKLEHPCLFMTKGQMLQQIDPSFMPSVQGAMTCGANRQNRYFDNTHNRHCGACVPCILRQISVCSVKLPGLQDAEYDSAHNLDHGNHSEYKSSLAYFKTFATKIRKKEIRAHLDLHPQNYSENDYEEKTSKMLNDFKDEVDLFLLEQNE